MMKFKFKPIVKWYKNEKYIFIKGVAIVPGMRRKTLWPPIPYTITLKEFKEFSKLPDEPLPSQLPSV